MAEIYTVLRALKRRGWIAAILTAIGLAAGIFYGETAHRYYRAMVTMQLNPTSSSTPLPYSGAANQPFSDIAASDAAYLHSRSFGALVVQELKVPATPDQVTSAIATTVAPNTTIMAITVTWDNPQYAADIANGVAQLFVREDLKRQEASRGAALSELQNSFDYYKARITPLRQLRDDAQRQVNQGDLSKLTILNQLDSQLHDLEDTYSKLLVDLDTARSALSTATIIDPATVPTRATGTGVSRTAAFGLALGLVAGLALVLLVEYLDNTVKDVSELQRIVGAAPLGTIGVIRAQDAGSDENKLVTIYGPKDPISESFRSIRTTLSFLAVERPLKHMLVTSTLPEEGKTVIASNLAASLAQAGSRVILVDADLRVPRIHYEFGLPNLRGLSDLLRLDPDAEDIVDDLKMMLVPGPVEGLQILTSGPLPPNPAELLGSIRLPAVMLALSRVADVVVYDTPPMIPVTDALLIANRSDWTIVVARAGKTRGDALTTALRNLQQADVRVGGVIFNMVDQSALSPYYQYHYQYYGGHGGSGQSPRSGSRGKASPPTAGRRGRLGRLTGLLKQPASDWQ